MKKEKTPLISVIITTKNEELVIEQLLLSIKNQTYQNFEIILVDNNSTDKTVEKTKKYTKLVFTKGPERSAQRNFGATKATGELLLFLDADMVLTPKVLEECIYKMRDETYQALVIPEQSIGEGFWSLCKMLEREFYLGVSWIESARCFRRSIFKNLKGYDETLSGPEDFDLPQRVKNQYGATSTGRVSSFIIHNEGKLKFWELMKRKFYYGQSMKLYIQKSANQKHALQQGNILARYILFLRDPKKLFQHPIVSIGMIVLKTSELIALALGTIVGKEKKYEKHN